MREPPDHVRHQIRNYRLRSGSHAGLTSGRRSHLLHDGRIAPAQNHTVTYARLISIFSRSDFSHRFDSRNFKYPNAALELLPFRPIRIENCQGVAHYENNVPATSNCCSHAGSGYIVLDWNDVALAAVQRNATPPPIAARALAMTHVAIYDAVNSIDPTHQSFRVYVPDSPTTSREAAAAQAAFQTLLHLYPNDRRNLPSLAQSLAQIPDGPESQQESGWAIS